jgi:hexosaminidase
VDQTYIVLEKVLSDVMALFPDAYLHLGHDEINAKCWEQYPGGVNSTLKAFHTRLQPILDRLMSMHGSRKISVWEEPFTNLNAKGSRPGLAYDTVQLWTKGTLDSVHQVQAANKQVIISYYKAWYLDCGHGSWISNASTENVGWCPYRNWQAMYQFDPFGAGTRPNGDIETEPPMHVAKLPDAASNAILGGEACMWSEQVDEFNVVQRIFPRALAFAERAWSHPGNDSGDLPGQVPDMSSVASRLDAARTQLLVRRRIPSAPIFPSWCSGRPDRCKL